MNARVLRGLLKKFMYRDVGRAWRSEHITVDNTDDFQMTLTVEDFPCHLAQYGKQLYAHRDDRAQKLTDDLRLCCAPDVDIRPNDVVDVEHEGQTWRLIAGEAFKYPTHQEISVRRRKEAGQT